MTAAEWIRNRRAKGLCQCGQKAVVGVRCDTCYAKENEYRRLKYNIQPWQPGKRGRPPIGAWEHL